MHHLLQVTTSATGLDLPLSALHGDRAGVGDSERRADSGPRRRLACERDERCALGLAQVRTRVAAGLHAGAEGADEVVDELEGQAEVGGRRSQCVMGEGAREDRAGAQRSTERVHGGLVVCGAEEGLGIRIVGAGGVLGIGELADG